MTARRGIASNASRTGGRTPSCWGERGSATIWLLLMVPPIMVSAGLVVDGGRALAARQQATGLAAEGARAAVDRVDPRVYRNGAGPAVAPGSTRAAACSWVAGVRPEATCTATSAADGRVSVTVSVVYQPVLLIGFGERTATGRGTARPAVGVQDEVVTP